MAAPVTRGAALAVAAAMLCASLAGCVAAEEVSLPPEEALSSAKERLDTTAGIRFGLATEDLPGGVVALESVDGELTHAPAFRGTITAPLRGLRVKIDVVAVGDEVQVRFPFTAEYQEFDPSRYAIPDPSGLLDPDSGLSSLLSATEDAERGESIRGGADNRTILTEYRGRVPGEDMARVLPLAVGEFEAVYTISDDGELSQAELTGRFNGADEPANTYTLTIEEYDVDTDISLADREGT